MYADRVKLPIYNIFWLMWVKSKTWSLSQLVEPVSWLRQSIIPWVDQLKQPITPPGWAIIQLIRRSVFRVAKLISWFSLWVLKSINLPGSKVNDLISWVSLWVTACRRRSFTQLMQRQGREYTASLLARIRWDVPWKNSMTCLTWINSPVSHSCSLIQ